MKRLLLITILGVLLLSSTSSSSYFATTDFVITITFSGANQTESDTRRDNGLLDYAKARNLAIYQSDGITVNAALVAPAVRTDIKKRLKDDVVRYRETITGNAAAAAVKPQMDLEIPE